MAHGKCSSEMQLIVKEAMAPRGDNAAQKRESLSGCDDSSEGNDTQ